MRILIADDDPAFRRVLQEILVSWGHEVIVARDGNEAWQTLRAGGAPQLAILDWLMPGMNGVEVCRNVRKDVQEPYPYLILLTSQNRDEDLVLGMEAGADDYVTKPLKTNELRVRLEAGKRMIELQNALAARAADLEVANRDLESFSCTVANDLLESLMAIGTTARKIEDIVCKSEDQQCHNYAKLIYTKTRRLGEFIGIMHDFFRPMRKDLHQEAIDLSELAGKTAVKLRLAKPLRRVTFRIADGIEVTGDRKLLQMVLDNLFDNAWKHTGGREEALIEFGVTEFAGKRAYFVRDNGTGFDVSYADRLFKPFQRMPGTEEFAGHGTGLATVERIIRRHGGRVWAEGEPEKGATFYFNI
jgi:two-component system, sensor histidine kinase and response regulator